MGALTVMKLKDALTGVTRLGLDTPPIIYFVEANPQYDVLLLWLIGIFVICLPASADGAPLPNPFSAVGFRDGVALYASLYSPSEDSMESIYGSGLMFGVRGKLATSEHVGLAASIGVLQKGGNPYFDNTFTTADLPSRLTIVPVEMSHIIHIISSQPEMGRRIRNLYIGIGVNHIWARERAPGMSLAKGAGFGWQVLTGADFFILRDFALSLEIKYLRNRLLMNLETDSDYRARLDGVIVQTMVVWNLGERK
jgi:hypothetical protein